MALLPKTLQSSVRDVLAQSVRRAPSQSNGYNSDSLRRLVLQRNALIATVETQDASSPVSPKSIRLFSTDVPKSPVDGSKLRHSLPGPSSPVLRKTRSIHDVSSAAKTEAVSSQEDTLEEQWFDAVLEDLVSDDEMMMTSPQPHQL
ncbi:hypothetical protein ACI68E_003993 [Malassezia pachydermatis]